MNNLEQFPCYEHTELHKFTFQSITPVSVTLPYNKALSGNKLIKKKVNHDKGDLVAFSFALSDTPNVSDGTVLLIDFNDEKKSFEVLTHFQQVYKGHRVVSYICQMQ
ncbi:hypothetical protein ACOJEA_004769 [Klebsiella aerogenes]